MSAFSSLLPRLSPNRAFGLFVCLLLLIGMAGFSYLTQRIQQEILRARLQQAGGQVQLFEDRLTQTLTTLGLVLDTLRDQVVSVQKQDDHLLLHFQSALHNAPYLRSISLVGAEGEILLSSNPDNIGAHVNLASFWPSLDGGIFLRLGTTLQGHDFHNVLKVAEGPLFIPALMPARGGAAPLYLVVSINPGYFLTHMETALPREEGSVDVLRADGMLLFSTQEGLLAGQPHPQDLGLESFAETGMGSLDGLRHDSLPALSAWRSVRNFPLLVSVHLDREQVLHDWREEVQKLAWMLMAGLALVLLPTTVLFLREKRALHQKSLAVTALAASEERYRLTFAAVRDGLWAWDVQSGNIRCDAHWFEMLGYPADAFAVTRDKWLNLVHPDDRPGMLQRVEDRLGAAQGFVASYRMAQADGGWLWVELRGKSVSFANGQPLRVVGTQTDISARVRAEQAVAAAARHRMALLDHIASGIFVAAPDRTIVEVSARGAEMFGYRQEELLGQSFSCLHVSHASFERFGKAYEKLRAQGQVQQEWLMRGKDGRLFWTSLYGTWLEPGCPEVIWTIVDTDYQHQMQASLLASRKRLEVIMDQFPGGLLVEDEQRRIVLVNHAFCELFGLEGRPEGVVGEGFSSCVTRIRSAFSHPEHFEWQLQELGEGLAPATRCCSTLALCCSGICGVPIWQGGSGARNSPSCYPAPGVWAPRSWQSASVWNWSAKRWWRPCQPCG